MCSFGTFSVNSTFFKPSIFVNGLVTEECNFLEGYFSFL